jgi:hypothetical protein
VWLRATMIGIPFSPENLQRKLCCKYGMLTL